MLTVVQLVKSSYRLTLSPRKSIKFCGHYMLEAWLGGGKKHSANLNIAMARTGLNLSRIKVYK